MNFFLTFNRTEPKPVYQPSFARVWSLSRSVRHTVTSCVLTRTKICVGIIATRAARIRVLCRRSPSIWTVHAYWSGKWQFDSWWDRRATLPTLEFFLSYERGLVTMLDAKNGDLLRRMADAHAPQTAVLHLRFTFFSNFALCGDSSGCVFTLGFNKRLGVSKFLIY